VGLEDRGSPYAISLQDLLVCLGSFSFLSSNAQRRDALRA
jgi:hypothetical protein